MQFLKYAVIATALAAPTAIFAQDAEDAIEGRQGYMSLISIEMGKLSGMAKGEIDYDEAAAAAAAANLEALTNYNVAPLFAVPGTSSDDTSESATLPAAFENPEGFSAKLADLKNAAAGSQAAVTGGQASIGPVLQQLGGTCKACHDDYRKPR